MVIYILEHRDNAGLEAFSYPTNTKWTIAPPPSPEHIFWQSPKASVTCITVSSPFIVVKTLMEHSILCKHIRGHVPGAFNSHIFKQIKDYGNRGYATRLGWRNCSPRHNSSPSRFDNTFFRIKEGIVPDYRTKAVARLRLKGIVAIWVLSNKASLALNFKLQEVTEDDENLVLGELFAARRKHD